MKNEKILPPPHPSLKAPYPPTTLLLNEFKPRDMKINGSYLKLHVPTAKQKNKKKKNIYEFREEKLKKK